MNRILIEKYQEKDRKWERKTGTWPKKNHRPSGEVTWILGLSNH